MCRGRWWSTSERRRAALAPQQQGSPLMAGTAKGTGSCRWLWGVGWSQRGWGPLCKRTPLQSWLSPSLQEEERGGG